MSGYVCFLSVGSEFEPTDIHCKITINSLNKKIVLLLHFYFYLLCFDNQRFNCAKNFQLVFVGHYYYF